MNIHLENKKNPNRPSKSRRVPGISWRLFGILALFVVLILVIIWIFQVLLLNIFYQESKTEEFSATRSQIFASIDDEEEMEKIVYVRSVETDTCIRLFKVVQGRAETIVDSDVNSGCILHHLDGEELHRIYKIAVEKGGVYSKKITKPGSETYTSAIYTSVHTNSEGVEYILMMDSRLAPLDATVNTLQKQFGWIMCILVMGAMIVALIISRVICSPLERMGRSARVLAKGDYNNKFEGGGYREANDLADALNYAAEELAKTDDLQKELVANISHDLRTPLTMIKGYGEVMRDIPGENTPENVQVIIDETERLSELVNDMLDLSKLRSGTRKPDSEVFDLTETVREVLQRYGKLTEKDEYKISLEADENVMVFADRTMILQVVYNLVNNALNYTGDDKRVTIDQSVWDNKVRISVIDTGEGIPPEDIPYIWDRYYKVDKVHKRAKIGTGLGLSIVKGVLEAHGASYGVESREGEGSNFWFELDTYQTPDEKNNTKKKSIFRKDIAK